jgi:hypothetical protein
MDAVIRELGQTLRLALGSWERLARLIVIIIFVIVVAWLYVSAAPF